MRRLRLRLALRTREVISMSNKWSLINADSGEKTWLTPRHIIEALGHFDTDPCCPPNMPWRTADTMLTKAEDGATAPWHGRVWLNPPYGRDALPFLSRMAAYQGGVSHLSSSAPTPANGMNGYSPSRTPSSLSADASASATQAASLRSQHQRPRHSSHTLRRTLLRSSGAASKAIWFN